MSEPYDDEPANRGRGAQLMAGVLAEQVRSARGDHARALGLPDDGPAEPASESDRRDARPSAAPIPEHPDSLFTPAVLDDTARLLLRQIDRAARH